MPQHALATRLDMVGMYSPVYKQLSQEIKQLLLQTKQLSPHNRALESPIPLCLPTVAPTAHTCINALARPAPLLLLHALISLACHHQSYMPPTVLHAFISLACLSQFCMPSSILPTFLSLACLPQSCMPPPVLHTFICLACL